MSNKFKLLSWHIVNMISALKKKFVTNEITSAGSFIGAGQSHQTISPNLPASKVIHLNDTQRRRIRNIKKPTTPLGVQIVSAELQKKFSHGVNFNS